MSHLSPERLAALLDEQPTAAELAHLAACGPCRRERGAYEALAAMSKTGPSLGQPLTSWDRLGPALKRDAIIETDIAAARRARISRGWLQAAAAVLLVAGGAAAGRMTASTNLAAVDPIAVLSSEPTFTSVEEAQRAALQAQTLYQASMAYQANLDVNRRAVETPAVLKTRIAALDQVQEIVSAALEEAPFDPVVNSLYLNTHGQREASLRVLNTTSTRTITY